MFVISPLDLEKIAGLKSALHDGEITLSNDDFDDIERLARFGLQAKAFLSKNEDDTREALVQWDDEEGGEPAWAMRLEEFDSLVFASRALDQENQVRAAAGAGTEEKP